MDGCDMLVSFCFNINHYFYQKGYLLCYIVFAKFNVHFLNLITFSNHYKLIYNISISIPMLEWLFGKKKE